MQKEDIEKLVEKSLQKKPSLFLIDIQLKPDNQIKITLDGDEPVSVKNCVEVSREIEKELDQGEEDFSLEVTSTGLTTPLQFPRQYKKNIGRKLKVKTAEKKYKAKLIEADEDGVELQWKQREPKPIGKGKHTVQKQAKLAYQDIKEAKVMITFN